MVAWLQERVRSGLEASQNGQEAVREESLAKKRRLGGDDMECDGKGALQPGVWSRSIGGPHYRPIVEGGSSYSQQDSGDAGQLKARYRRFERDWWYSQTEEYFDSDSHGLKKAQQALGMEPSSSSSSRSATTQAIQAAETLSQEARVLCGIIAETLPHLRPVHLGTVLDGLDSLRLSRLAYTIKARCSRAVSLSILRAASTVAGVLAALEDAEEVGTDLSTPSDLNREYAVWFSPGQYSPMGAWVLRTDQPIDEPAMKRAVAKLVERHSALRAEIIDPLHYMSLLYDAAAVFSLYGPILAASRFWPLRLLRRLLSWALACAWPRIRCRTREEVYGGRYPDAVPFVMVKNDVDGTPLQGQDRFERELKRRSRNMTPPIVVVGYELKCYLFDVWVYTNGNFKGRFSIVRAPAALLGAPNSPPDSSGLAYVDIAAGEWGLLVAPGSSTWRTPPYRFPALYFATLNTGSVLWIRMDKADELRVCYKESTELHVRDHHFPAHRAAPQRAREAAGDPVIVQYMGITMFHSFSDGNSYMPLAQDLFALYDAERSGQVAVLPPLNGLPPFAKLEQRLMSTLHCRPSPVRVSLRGGLFRYQGMGYGYSFGFEPGATAVLEMAAAHYRIPFDVVLLGIVMCSAARADKEGASQAIADKANLIEFTLYAPMRDGMADSTMIGLFSDWRDMSIGVDFELATLLGTLVQLFHAFTHRLWTPFNALRKPERTIVNIQPLDMEPRSHFHHLGENLWHGGDRLREGPPKRPERMEWGRQPLTFNLEQQDENTWWILVDVGCNERPPSWMRKFSESMNDALNDLLYNPLVKVHRPFPEDKWF